MGQVKRNRRAVAAAERGARTVRGIRGTVPPDLLAVLCRFNVPAGWCHPSGRYEVAAVGTGGGAAVRCGCRCGAWHVPDLAAGGFFGAVAAVAMHRAGLRPGLVPAAGAGPVRAARGVLS